jgi:2-isopropylmalate synthase
MAKKDYIYLYDSTLRDGAQARGVDFTVSDKLAIAKALDGIGIDYIEGGWPGANPTDDAFFADQPKLKKAKITAFGMTRRNGRSAENDPGLQGLLDAHDDGICIVGKSWDWQVENALGVSKAENLRMIESSIAHLVSRGREVTFDAEHCFDGYKANPDYTLSCLKAAYEAGARWIVLCDTNGGSMPAEISEIVGEITQHIPGENLGIHCHNDTEQAVANSLAAVQAGVRQVQGTINGIGERCGNANLISIIPNLTLKLGFRTGVSDAKLKQLKKLSRHVDERLNRIPNAHLPFVGSAAFAHKGGLHVSAMAKSTKSYEHIEPELVGNERQILVSDKAGKSNIVTRLAAFGLEGEAENPKLNNLVKEIKEREQMGYAYEDADASFELLVRRRLGLVPDYFDLEHFRVTDERRFNAKGKKVTVSEAVVKLLVKGDEALTAGEGNGPVNALDDALRAALMSRYPKLKKMHLSDYKVRILTPQQATAALTRVMIESTDDKGNSWTTIGVSHNVIDASYEALRDAIIYCLNKA